MRSRYVVGAVGLSLLVTGAACSSSPEGSSSAQIEGNTGAALSKPLPVAASSSSSSSSGGPLLDLGSTDPTQVVTVSVIFKVKNSDSLEAYVQATQDPSSPYYHRFLSVKAFTDLFSPSQGDINRVANYLTSFGITVGNTLADQLVLRATGTVGQFTQAFTFTMHDYQNGSTRFHRPATAPSLPHSLSDVMLVVAGFNNQPAFQRKSRSASAVAGFSGKLVLPQPGRNSGGGNSTATGSPGNYTVGDFANQYNVNPLYKAGVDGTGSTIGVATLAGFYPADAYTYWSSIGLDVRQDRITQVHVDDGAPISSEAGSGETSLDVEQSGGLAPNANIVVYDAPNTDGGFLDLFYQAASDNVVDSLSVSWGETEVFYFEALDGADYTIELQAFHQAFLEGAAQGISMFASSGDDGAYDANGSGLSNFLCVDAPASDPAMTAAGGTTTPITVTGDMFGGSPSVSVTVAGEQVWGWDWLQSFLNANDIQGANDWNLFSTGSGGGVSTYWPMPWYQEGTRGIRKTEANQVVSYQGQTLTTLPAGFQGRNVPDVSADADPFSGYLLYSTADGGWNNFYGGTSFVAPQMNGVSALLRQHTGHRLGLWNAMLYRFAQSRAVNDVTGGDNWFYNGVRGYEPATGVGVLDVAAFAQAVTLE